MRHFRPVVAGSVAEPLLYPASPDDVVVTLLGADGAVIKDLNDLLNVCATPHAEEPALLAPRSSRLVMEVADPERVADLIQNRSIVCSDLDREPALVGPIVQMDPEA